MNEKPGPFDQNVMHLDPEYIWESAIESLNTAQCPGDVYLNLGLSGSAIGVIGPWFMPHDAIGVITANAVGSHGTVYSIDPQGDGGGTSNTEYAIGSGNSSLCALQIQLLRESGLPLGSFEWLGNDSSIIHIPKTDKTIVCIADHGMLEFLTGSVPDWYVREGVRNTIRSLPVGGLYIHHTVSVDLLNYTLNKENQFVTSFSEWLTSLGTRITYRTFRADSYRIPVVERFKERFAHSAGFEKYFPKTHEILMPYIREQEMLIPERLIRYPMRTVMMLQKIDECQ